VEEVASKNKVWAQSFSQSKTTVVAPVVAGGAYHITMWYAFDRLEFELRTSM
jgi:hypothetical protein